MSQTYFCNLCKIRVRNEKMSNWESYFIKYTSGHFKKAIYAKIVSPAAWAVARV